MIYWRTSPAAETVDLKSIQAEFESQVRYALRGRKCYSNITMKRLLGVASALTCALAAPLSAQALPAYATLIAMDHCEYLSYGWTWSDAMSQALSDNYHWFDDMKADGERSNQAIIIAIDKKCSGLNKAAFAKR